MTESKESTRRSKREPAADPDAPRLPVPAEMPPHLDDAHTALMDDEEEAGSTMEWRQQRARYRRARLRWGQPSVGDCILLAWLPFTSPCLRLQSATLKAQGRVIYVWGEINSATIIRVQAEITAIMRRSPTGGWIGLRIDSDGGSTDHSLALVSWLKRNVPESLFPIATEAVGACHSAATFLLICGVYRISYAPTRILIHGPRLHFQGPVMVTEARARMWKQELKQARLQMKAHYKAHTKLTDADLAELLSTDRDVEVPYTSEQAMEKGLVDHVMPIV